MKATYFLGPFDGQTVEVPDDVIHLADVSHCGVEMGAWDGTTEHVYVLQGDQAIYRGEG